MARFGSVKYMVAGSEAGGNQWTIHVDNADFATLEEIHFYLTRRDIAATSKPFVPLEEPQSVNFPDVTVVFADIAGFTSFSASRQPRDVFRLLHRFYSKIDDKVLEVGGYKYEVAGELSEVVAVSTSVASGGASVLG